MNNQYLDLAIELAQDAGKIMKQNFTVGMSKTWKEDNTPVTVSDEEINALVIEKITNKYPQHGIIGEEESFKKDSKYQWVVDPIDGTFAFAHGFPTFAFSLALVEDGESVVGVIYDPIVDRLLTAVKGSGAFLNGEKICVSKNTRIDTHSFISVNVPKEKGGIREDLGNKYGCKLPALYSAVYPSMLVAAGEFLAEIYGFDKPWDGAAAKIIVEEAGGKVTDLAGLDQRYDGTINGFVASNGLIHNEIIAICKAHLT